jgi:hypothetical protein
LKKTDKLFEQLAKAQKAQEKYSPEEKAEQLLAKLFPEQRAFVEDPCRRKAALCPRRAGKSFSVLVYAAYICLKRPDSRVLVLARVRRQVKATFWAEFKRINRSYGLGAHCRNNDLEVEFPNGSMLYFAGADTQEEAEKYRGTGYDLVAIDECKSFPASLLQELLAEIVEPALLDRRGSVVLIGTPGSILAGPFYAVTSGDLSVIPTDERAHWTAKRFGSDELGKWSCHRWSSQDNIACPWIWEEALDFKQSSGLADDDPVWVREYLGQWVADGDALVYAYGKIEDGRCDWVRDDDGPHGLPTGQTWRYILGVDLGYHDATAFVVGAWSPTSPALYYVHVEKHEKLHIGEIADRCISLESQFGEFDARVFDTGGLGKTLVESLAQIYGIVCTTAEKRDKHDYIKLMNTDIIRGRIKLDANSLLADEWRTLQWADNKKFKIDK